MDRDAQRRPHAILERRFQDVHGGRRASGRLRLCAPHGARRIGLDRDECRTGAMDGGGVRGVHQERWACGERCPVDLRRRQRPVVDRHGRWWRLLPRKRAVCELPAAGKPRKHVGCGNRGSSRRFRLDRDEWRRTRPRSRRAHGSLFRCSGRACKRSDFVHPARRQGLDLDRYAERRHQSLPGRPIHEPVREAGTEPRRGPVSRCRPRGEPLGWYEWGRHTTEGREDRQLHDAARTVAEQHSGRARGFAGRRLGRHRRRRRQSGLRRRRDRSRRKGRTSGCVRPIALRGSRWRDLDRNERRRGDQGPGRTAADVECEVRPLEWRRLRDLR